MSAKMLRCMTFAELGQRGNSRRENGLINRSKRPNRPGMESIIHVEEASIGWADMDDDIRARFEGFHDREGHIVGDRAVHQHVAFFVKDGRQDAGDRA